jgi:hypothetical protein
MAGTFYMGSSVLQFLFSPTFSFQSDFVFGNDFSSSNLAKSQYDAGTSPARKTAFGTNGASHSPTRAESSFVEVGVQKFAVVAVGWVEGSRGLIYQPKLQFAIARQKTYYAKGGKICCGGDC